MSFAWENGWTPLQSVERAVRQGVILEKIKSKLPNRRGQSEAVIP